MSEKNKKPKTRFDEAGSKLDKPIGLPTNDQLEAIKFARNQERDIGKLARDAKRNGDINAYLAAVSAGYTNRGIENVDDKNARYLEAVNQRRFWGDRGVGPGQPPAGGAQPTSRLDASSTPRLDAQIPSRLDGSITPKLDAQQAAGTSPENPRSAAQGSSGGQWVNVGTPPATGTPPAPAPATPAAPDPTPAPPTTTGGQPSAPAKPKSFFEERASGRKAFVDTVETLRRKEGGMTSKEKEQAQARGTALGLTPQQIQETLDGQTELSPEAIAGRAKGRKNEAYQKEFEESDKQWAKLLEKYPDQKAMLEGLTPQQKKDALAKGKENAGEKIASAKAKGDRAGREVQDSLDRFDAFVEKADDASATREGFKDARSKRLSEKPMLVGGKDVAKATDEDRCRWAEESQRRKVDANRPSLNQFMDSLDDPIGPIEDTQRNDGGVIADRQNIINESDWGNSLLGDANKVANVISGQLDKVSLQRLEATLESSRQKEGSRAMNFADAIGGYLTGKKKKPEVKKGLSSQASINTGKIQESYEKAFKGADNILFGLSFDQREV